MQKPIRPVGSSGFTLMELMVTLALGAVILGVAIPNLTTFIQNNRLSGIANDLLRSFQMARTEAIKSQQNVVICASANPTVANPTCSYGSFSSGWIVFNDTNSNWQSDGVASEAVLERHGAVDPTVAARYDFNAIESYGQTGFANPAGAKTPTRTIALCDKRGNQALGLNSTARAIFVSATGRVRVSQLKTDTDTAFAVAGLNGACPP